MDIPSRLDLLAIGRNYVLQRAARIDPSQVDVEGSDVNIFVGSQSVVNDTVAKQLAYSANRLLLDGADGVDLDRLVLDRYRLPRKGASPAVGTVQLTRPTAAVGAGSIPIGTNFLSKTGSTYISTTVANFGSGSLKSQCNVRAAQAGKASQVGAHAITRFAQTPFDASIAVDNAQTTAGGENIESDDLYRNRARAFWNTARRGVLSAIEQGALAVPGVVSAQAIEALTTTGLPARVVNLYISDSSGVASDALAQQVVTSLNDFRAGGIAVIVSTSIPLLVDVELALQFLANVDTVTLSASIQASVFEFINSLPVNGTLYVAELYSVLQRFKSAGLVPSRDNILAPAGDLVPPTGQTIRTTLAQVVID